MVKIYEFLPKQNNKNKVTNVKTRFKYIKKSYMTYLYSAFWLISNKLPKIKQVD